MDITPQNKKSLLNASIQPNDFYLCPLLEKLKNMSLNFRTSALMGALLSLFLFNSTAFAQKPDHWETIILPGQQCRYLVPGANVDPAWTGTGFDNSGWTTGTGNYNATADSGENNNVSLLGLPAENDYQWDLYPGNYQRHAGERDIQTDQAVRI